ncbi:MAG: amidophosphoribosyltransferase [Nitrososphaerota archaeon]|nr:amidophosphoribosyltransferase [Nitrososphaerota archaeon]
MKSDAINEWFNRLPGSIGIGNVRYTTSGKCDELSIIQGTQPFTATLDDVKIALSFNGNIVNTQPLKKEMAKNFSGFIYNCDSDLVCHKMLLGLKQTNDLVLAAKGVMENLDGAFSVTGITGDGTFFAFKDPHGIKPLCAGHDPNGKTFAFSSETVSLDMNSFVRDFELNPGELVIASKEGFKRIQVIPNPRRAFCAFEFAYFARPDSIFNGKYVYEIREAFGRNIVKEYPHVVNDSDIIMSVPETGDDPAMGVHEASGLRWERASRRHRYVTERAFILLNAERYSTIDKKINILDEKIKGKRVIITEDSIVRGDTTKVIIAKMRNAGAKKVYVFVTFPRIVGPCFYGIDMSSYGQLVGSRHSAEEIAKIIGADGVCYQSLENLLTAIGEKEDTLCLACVTGKYPTPCAQKIADAMKKRFLDGYEDKGRVYENDEVQP